MTLISAFARQREKNATATEICSCFNGRPVNQRRPIAQRKAIVDDDSAKRTAVVDRGCPGGTNIARAVCIRQFRESAKTQPRYIQFALERLIFANTGDNESLSIVVFLIRLRAGVYLAQQHVESFYLSVRRFDFFLVNQPI